MQPLDQYLALIRKSTRSEKESKTLWFVGLDLLGKWDTAIKRYGPTSTDQLVAFIEQYGNRFAEAYAVAQRSPSWADLEKEQKRLTFALIEYYTWLATLPKLSAGQRKTFETVDMLLRVRLAQIGRCLFLCDRDEAEAIAKALHIELVKSHIPLTLTGEGRRESGWAQVGTAALWAT